MKFCKNLQRVMEIADPEWAPYWPNYKFLKKVIKGIKPTHSNNNSDVNQEGPQSGQDSSSGDDNPTPLTGNTTSQNNNTNSAVTNLGTNPGEVAFFKLLHHELKKATHFFDQAQTEYAIREERVRQGMELMLSQHDEYGPYTTEDRWPRLAQSIFRLYRELLLLETFCIMTYCGFSKILKKHDKLTGHSTKNKFMAKIVNQANFVNYPRVLEMISRCERLYENVSRRLLEQHNQGNGQQVQLLEDERLFIHMIHRLNEQVVMPGSITSSLSSNSSVGAGKGKGIVTNSSAARGGVASSQIPSVVTAVANNSMPHDKSRKLQELVAEIEEDQEAAAKLAASKGEKRKASWATEGESEAKDHSLSRKRSCGKSIAAL